MNSSRHRPRRLSFEARWQTTCLGAAYHPPNLATCLCRHTFQFVRGITNFSGTEPGHSLATSGPEHASRRCACPSRAGRKFEHVVLMLPDEAARQTSHVLRYSSTAVTFSWRADGAMLFGSTPLRSVRFAWGMGREVLNQVEDFSALADFNNWLGKLPHAPQSAFRIWSSGSSLEQFHRNCSDQGPRISLVYSDS